MHRRIWFIGSLIALALLIGVTGSLTSAAPAPAADGSLTVTMSGATQTSGTEIEFSIVVANGSSSTVSNIYVAGSIPTGAKFASVTATPAGATSLGGDSAVASWVSPSIAAASKQTFSYKVTVTTAPPGPAHAFIHWLSPAEGTALSGDVSFQATVLRDAFFGAPFIDVDELRDTPVPHRYVHGGFQGTDTRFSFYFPSREQYRGRMITFLQGGQGGSEKTAMAAGAWNIAQAFSLGAYLVESNQGHIGDLAGLKGNMTILGYRASAESSRYSKIVATQMYGAWPKYSYIYGGSGGGVRSINSLESVPDVWNGGVPYIMGHQWQSRFFSILSNEWRVLRPKMAEVFDAVEVGGSGDPFLTDLNSEQREALAALYRVGFARGVPVDPMNENSFLTWTFTADLIDREDPRYWEDFWSLPGYMGFDEPKALADSMVSYETTVQQVVPAGIRMDVDKETLAKSRGAHLKILTGAAAGRELIMYQINDDGVIVATASTPDGVLKFKDVAPGDRVRIDNRKFVAYTFWYRHQIDPSYAEFQQFVVDGRPMYPQRPLLPRPATTDYTYKPLPGLKMIIVQGTYDVGVWPSSAVSYHQRVAANLGDRLDDSFRLWWVEYGMHPEPAVTSTTRVRKEGFIQQALSDLVKWVEQGKAPPTTTGYEHTKDSALILANAAAERKSIQPVVTVIANGGASRVELKAGTPINFQAVAEVPPGTGKIISVQWDLDGSGPLPYTDVTGIDGSLTKMTVTNTHTYDTPGTYFPAVRVWSHRDGNVNATFDRLANLGRIRVVVR